MIGDFSILGGWRPTASAGSRKGDHHRQSQELEGQLRAQHIQLSPEALEEVFKALREQITECLGRQDIQAARVLIERVISKIELGYDQVHIWYRYPLEVGLAGQKGRGKETLDAQPIERSLHDMDRKSIQSI